MQPRNLRNVRIYFKKGFYIFNTVFICAEKI